jgi:hypothetical protein
MLPSLPLRRLTAAALLLTTLATGCATSASASSMPGLTEHHGNGVQLTTADRSSAMLATAAYQDVAVAERDGYQSSIETLGCFQHPERGGMGVHYIRADLLDARVDIRTPEALVYELDAANHVVGLVGHEYIVPIDQWTSSTPPGLFGMSFHRHPTLPLWVLHAWLWKDNPSGVFEDWNPAVRQCPTGAPIFGIDLPTPAPSA